MKTKVIYCFFACMVALGIVGCTSDVGFVDENLYSQETGENVEYIKVVARDFIQADKISRTSVDVGENGATFTWSKGDTIGIFPNQGYQVAFAMADGAGSQSANFDGGGWGLRPSSKYMAYYPFEYNNKSNQSISVNYVGQEQHGDSSTEHLSMYDYMAASATTPDEGTVEFDFKHLGALLQFKLRAPSSANITSLTLSANDNVFIRKGTVDLTQKEPRVESADKATSISMAISDIQVSYVGQEITLYMMMAPVDLTGQRYTLKVGNDNGQIAEVELLGRNFEPGKAYAVTADLMDFQDASLQIADNRGKVVGHEGGVVTLEYLTNTECEFEIDEGSKSWITPMTSRALSRQSLSFTVAPNDGEKNRRSTIIVKSSQNNLAVEYVVLQGAPGTFAVVEEGGCMPIGILSSNYKATSSSTDLGNLVDDNLSTYFEVNANSNIFIDWEGPYSIPIKNVRSVVGGGDYGISMNQLRSSSDGADYSNIALWVGFSRMEDFYISNWSVKARSMYFRYNIMSNHGAASTRIVELGYELDVDADKDIETFEDLVARGSSFTQNATTPMGNHYANKHVTTDEDRQWLMTATNEPDLLPSASSYTLRPYEVDLYPWGEPVPADINQHGVGDCSALAVFAEMAYLFPDFIKSIITDHGDGTYTVAMFDPQGKPVDVKIQATFLGDNNGIGACSGKNGEATWGTVLEKAIMKWNKIYQVNPDINGIGSEHVAPLFTGEGNSFAISPNSLLPNQLEQAARVALDNRMITIGGFNKGGLSYNSGPETVTAHAYSFMLSTEPEAMFTMRNPWGNSPGGMATDDGVVDIYNDGVIPPTIDMRIIYPGVALKYAVKDLEPYIPPVY